MGGMGGMGGGRPQREEADTTKLYELLGVSKSADATEIRKGQSYTPHQHNILTAASLGICACVFLCFVLILLLSLFLVCLFLSAYRKAALTHHPDRGGDPEKFKGWIKQHIHTSINYSEHSYDRQCLFPKLTFLVFCPPDPDVIISCRVVQGSRDFVRSREARFVR